ncbi:uncharacterized protein LOC105183623 [Harpegnathos saltator]|uniref:uncharacterized protein LOC105183623 n=1 Tax=Harpegnathos saltator TaxID=610380 RepID=UPI000DBEDD7F|nr:uncharacterized protein LOC105183623 [Harpegnathos saltator]
MKSRVPSSRERFVSFFWKVVCWLWETLDLVLIIVLDYWARMIELILVLMNITFQVICFLRDLCIDSMQTFANVFRGIVNVVGGISREDVEDFASACIVVFLYTVAVRMFVNLLRKVYTTGRYARLASPLPRDVVEKTTVQKPGKPTTSILHVERPASTVCSQTPTFRASGDHVKRTRLNATSRPILQNPYVKLFNVPEQRTARRGNNNNNPTMRGHARDADRKPGRRMNQRNNRRHRPILESN